MTDNGEDGDDLRFPARPIVLITGGTGAVGFGICLRLLYQLSQPIQADLSASNFRIASPGSALDLKPNWAPEPEDDHQSPYATPNGLTLLIGCRDESKCISTRAELLRKLTDLIKREDQTEHEDIMLSYIDRQTGQVETITFDEYRSRWLDRLRIEWLPLDLYHAQTVFQATKTIKRQYGYLTHLLLNAGGGPFVGINWLGLVKAFFRNFLNALTHPDYLIEAPTVVETIDKLPETWQLNVFSHYLLARELLPTLAIGSERFSSPARMIWTSSLDGQAIHFDRKDIYCYQPGHAYHSTKYQSELVGQGFQAIISKHGFNSQVVSIVAHPGVVAGNMFLPIIGKLMDTMMQWVFYFARFILGSPHHLIKAYLAGLVWTKLCLTTEKSILRPEGEGNRFVRFGVRCNRLGHPFVVEESFQSEEELKARSIDQALVIDHCDRRANALIHLWESSES